MPDITIACVGRIKEKFYTDAISEYQKRLSRYCKFRITEVKDEATPDAPSPKEAALILEKEGGRLLEKIPDGAYVIALCIEGAQLSSEALAKKIDTLALSGKSRLCFVIGGSLGLSETIKKRADFQLSFSPMTFPHQLMRVILSEQIYRAYTILSGQKYHK